MLIYFFLALQFEFKAYKKNPALSVSPNSYFDL